MKWPILGKLFSKHFIGFFASFFLSRMFNWRKKIENHSKIVLKHCELYLFLFLKNAVFDHFWKNKKKLKKIGFLKENILNKNQIYTQFTYYVWNLFKNSIFPKIPAIANDHSFKTKYSRNVKVDLSPFASELFICTEIYF